MLILERSVFGVRAAIWRFAAEGNSKEILLFPMVHVAEQAFYAEVATRLQTCDRILYEGVRSKTVGWVTQVYMQAVKSRRLGLVSQREMDLSHLADRIIRADMDGA